MNSTEATTYIPTTTKSPHSPWDDATWILTSAFIIFTMQSGFGLLESGMATRRNEVNIMMKNAIDVIFGGLLYWAFGYGISFGTSKGSNGFTGWGSFFLDPDDDIMGTEFSKFTFQASFATTATTIVSGAMAERTKLHAYIIFCLTNTLVYSFPAHWVWADNGWLKQMHVVDVAGVGPVHLVGGVTALIAAIMLKPRYGRFDSKQQLKSSSPVNSLLGLFILWWGWLGFNCGSTFGISGGKWKLAAKAAATTIMASCGGGITSFIISYLFHNKKVEVRIITNGILGSLVSITGICAVTYCWSAIIIGSIGAMIEAGGEALLAKLKIDDPVGATSVHFFCSIWGLLCCGLFARFDNIQMFSAYTGLFLGGGFELLGIQCIAIVSIIGWSAILSYINLKLLDFVIGLRVDVEDELLGADVSEHMCIPPGYDLEELKASVHNKIASDRPKVKRDTNEEVLVDDTSCLCLYRKSRLITKNAVHPLESPHFHGKEKPRSKSAKSESVSKQQNSLTLVDTDGDSIVSSSYSTKSSPKLRKRSFRVNEGNRFAPEKTCSTM